MTFSTSAIKNIKTRCPVCNSEWIEDQQIKKEMQKDNGGYKSAYNFDSCYRRCLKDNVAISNGQNPKLIFKNIKDNISEQLLSDQTKLEKLLENCFNRKHIKSKRNQFCFYRSEDAFTWAYFGYICKNGLLKELQEIMNLSSQITDIIFWGTPYFSEKPEELRKYLTDVSDACNENKSSRSEPDIIICTETELVFVEVKVDSNNPELSKSDKDKVLKYNNNHFYTDFKKSCWLYELTRNWTLGNLMAQNMKKSFKLVNLMPETHVAIEKKSKLQENFKSGIKNPEAYELMSWEQLFQCLNEEYKTYLLNRMNSILEMK